MDEATSLTMTSFWGSDPLARSSASELRATYRTLSEWLAYGTDPRKAGELAGRMRAIEAELLRRGSTVEDRSGNREG